MATKVQKVDWSGAIVGRHACAIADARAQGAKVPDCQCPRCTKDRGGQPGKHDTNRRPLELGHYDD